MKNKLWTFGDSFTFGHGCKSNLNYDYERQYPKGDAWLWPNIVSKKFNLNLVNCGYNGFSNSAILRKLTQSLSDIQKNDVVIVGKTDDFRFEIPNKNDMRQILVSTTMDNNPTEFYIRDYIKNIQLPYYKSLQYEIDLSLNSIHLLLTKLGVKNFIWSYSSDSKYNLDYEFSMYEKIRTATGGEIQDDHFSWKGHSQFSNKIIEILTKL